MDEEQGLRVDTLDGPLDDRIVLMGMSCVGKTTFARRIKTGGYNVHHFDVGFTYELCSLEGVSRMKNWEKIVRSCRGPRYVLDNWTTEDWKGKALHALDPLAAIYVLFDTRRSILRRYRSDVLGEDAYRGMYEKMYCRMPFESYRQPVRYFRILPEGAAEYNASAFRQFIAAHIDEDIDMTYDANARKWSPNV